MIKQSFSLIPFHDSIIPAIKITGTISRRNNILNVHFLLAGQIGLISFPGKTMHPQRRDELWRTTCFEFFLAIPEKPEYWEFNISPSGDWNVYHMDAYRQVGLREEISIQQLQFSVEMGKESVTVDATVDITPFIQENQEVQAETACVIEDNEGHETYWSLFHPGHYADFHRREGFILELAGSN